MSALTDAGQLYRGCGNIAAACTMLRLVHAAASTMLRLVHVATCTLLRLVLLLLLLL